MQRCALQAKLARERHSREVSMGDSVSGSVTRGPTAQKTATFQGTLTEKEWEQFKADIQAIVEKYANLTVTFTD